MVYVRIGDYVENNMYKNPYLVHPSELSDLPYKTMQVNTCPELSAHYATSIYNKKVTGGVEYYNGQNFFTNPCVAG